MTGEDQAQAFKAIGNIASTAGLTTFAMCTAKGIIAGYQTYASPYASLTESKRKLKRVRSQLQGLSPQRREQINIAMQSNSSDCMSLEDLEDQLETYVLPSDTLFFFRIHIHGGNLQYCGYAL
jgi:hypothetical protein